MSSSTIDCGILLGLLRRQQEAYRALRDLAERQRALVTQDDPQSLLKILADRRRLVDDLSRLAAEMAPYRRNWTGVLSVMSQAERDTIREMVESSGSLLAGILESDRADVLTLTERQRAVRTLLERNSCGATAHRAYAASAPAGRPTVTDACG